VGDIPAAPGFFLHVSGRYLIVLLPYFFLGGTFFLAGFFSSDGDDVASDVVKVKGEDPATPGPLI